MSIRIKLKINFDFSPQDRTPIIDKIKGKSLGLSNNNSPVTDSAAIDPNDSYIVFMNNIANEKPDSQRILLTIFKEMLK